jgi:hypothetical protein
MFTEAVLVGDTDEEHPLVVRSFEASVLAQLTGLRACILGLDNSPWQPYLKWSLLGALRDCASVKVGWPYQRPTVPRIPRMLDPYRAFARRAGWMAQDVLAAPALQPATVHIGDSRAPTTWRGALAGRRVDAIVTSPPYLNNFDYADATRLELYFWGVARSWSEMTSRVRADMVTASTQQSRKEIAADAAVTFAADCPRTARTVHALTVALHRERAARPRGKEYDQVLPSYFAELTRVLINIRTHAKSGAPVVLVLGDSAPYGVYVDTPGLLAAAAKELGFARETVRPLRQRGLRWQNNGTRHALALTEQLVLLRAPGAF